MSVCRMEVYTRAHTRIPPAHGMERWLGECASLLAGMHVFFADSLATFVEDLNRARPTLFVSVPRLWTKFQLGVYKKLPPEKLGTLLKIPIISYLVRRKIVKGLGLDCVRLAGSGSAPRLVCSPLRGGVREVFGSVDVRWP